MQTQSNQTKSKTKEGNGIGVRLKDSNGKGAVKGKSYSAKDFSEIGVIATYIVQQRGTATSEQVRDMFQNQLSSKIHKKTLEKILEALRKKQILSIEYGDEGRIYSIKRLKFNLAIKEWPEVGNLYLKLLNDPAGHAIKLELEGLIEKKGKKNDNRYPCEMADFEIKFKLITPMYGSQAFEDNFLLQAMYKRSKYNNTFDLNRDSKDYPLLFERHHTGGIMITTDCIRGFLENHIRQLNYGPSIIGKYFKLKEIVIFPKEIVIAKHPIMRPNEATGRSDGAGFAFFEAILPGEEITWNFALPTKNFIHPLQLKQWLKDSLEFPTRSMSPGRGVRVGTAELIDFKFTLRLERDKDLLDKIKSEEGQKEESSED